MISKTKKEVIKEILTRTVERIYPSKQALEKTLFSGKKLKVYHGIDPTGPHLHLGHSTNLLLLKKFQDLGHKVTLLIGDFTAQIGDPTGKFSTRRALSKKEVLENCKGYKKQAGKILDFSGKNKAEIQFNSKWYDKFSFKDGLELMTKITYGQMIKRSMFQKRIKEGKEIYLHELIYPLLQGYDSVALKADVEIGGNDQTFNMLIGRDLVREYQKREKFVVSTKLLINPKTNRKLMSKSEGGFVALDDPPAEMYGKIMALPDEVIIPMFDLCTEVAQKEIDEMKVDLMKRRLNPRKAKAELAREIVRMYHGDEKSQRAEEEFKKVFKEKRFPSKIPKIKIKEKNISVLDLLVKSKLSSSKSGAKRLILQGGFRINGELINDWKKKIKVENGMVLQAGKRKFKRIISS